MAADIEVAVAEDLDTCKSSSRIFHENNLTTTSAVQSLISDQCCRTGGGVDEELEKCTTNVTNRRAIVCEYAVGRGRASAKKDET